EPGRAAREGPRLAPDRPGAAQQVVRDQPRRGQGRAPALEERPRPGRRPRSRGPCPTPRRGTAGVAGPLGPRGQLIEAGPSPRPPMRPGVEPLGTAAIGGDGPLRPAGAPVGPPFRALPHSECGSTEPRLVKEWPANYAGPTVQTTRGGTPVLPTR